MPSITVELTKVKNDKTQHQQSLQYHAHNSHHDKMQRQASTSSRDRGDSEIQFKQSFSSRSPLFSCW
jgi:hypothetical protein